MNNSIGGFPLSASFLSCLFGSEQLLQLRQLFRAFLSCLFGSERLTV